MSEVFDYETLLPDNRTTFERSYEEAERKLLKRSDVLSWLNDPQATKSFLLDLMASEVGVRDWFFDDSELSKRLSVELAAKIQRGAGTKAGLIAALKAIEVDAEVERGERPFSLVVRSWSPRQINSDTLRRLEARVSEYKAERDTFSLAVGYRVSGSLFCGGSVVAAPRMVVGPWVPPLVESSGQIYIGGAITAAMRVVAT
ncbi:hypothetical protein J0J26_20500 [Vibrio vulnificus]|uniref:phage tail protein n=1 Tax=Vibrio vulnificus TaxID=672 RepID=UPI0019D46297|nr:phage tail protein [Vibrio vulnificus]MBN8090501.1 hypothetical protein [Vibrio vulnificus]MBN8119314.1 hypothetical protein [Vibrio vulnificus]